MAESKSVWLFNDFKLHLEKTGQFVLSNINCLAGISKQGCVSLTTCCSWKRSPSVQCLSHSHPEICSGSRADARPTRRRTLCVPIEQLIKRQRRGENNQWLTGRTAGLNRPTMGIRRTRSKSAHSKSSGTKSWTRWAKDRDRASAIHWCGAPLRGGDNYAGAQRIPSRGIHCSSERP